MTNLYADRNEFFSGSFTLDYFTQALRRYIKSKVLNGEIGEIKSVTIDPYHGNYKPASLIFGESNRLLVRYPIIEELLKENGELNKRSVSSLLKSQYFQYLFDNYRGRSFLENLRGYRNCMIKTKRTLSIYDWLKKSEGSFVGLTNFLSNNGHALSNADFPISIQIDSHCHQDSFVQLDGSHRRAVAFYLGLSHQSNIVLTIDDLNSYIQLNAESSDQYITRNWPIMLNFLQELNIYNGN